MRLTNIRWALTIALVSSMKLFADIAQDTPPDKGSSAESPARSNNVLEQVAAGAKLAPTVCGSCHLFPEPNLVDKKTWKNQILPHMETRLGVSPPDYKSNPEGEIIRARGIYPNQPLISKADWEAIVEYYVQTASETVLPQDPREEIKVGLKQFTVVPARFRYSPPLTTLVKISASRNRIYAGDDRARSLAILNSAGDLVDTLKVDNVPVSIVESTQGIYVTAIGSFPPSEKHQGELLFFERQGEGFGPRQVILKDLPRAAHTEFCDFNGDGKTDFATCLFGNLTGRFSWFENTGSGQYKERVLFDKSGAIQCVAYDFNGDGVPDIGLLVAQETEAFFILTNDGKGNFSSQTVFQKHPLFGHNHFELADFNGDGRMDLLVVNGDNGEYESPLKKYHGIRIYLNRGGGRFEEAFFYPLNGAIKAVARDFDGEGDLDIAAISFYPDYRGSPRESFVYLENTGGLHFSASTFSECISGRWVAMDVGDVDGDGDLDIVLGSYIRGPTPVPKFLREIWEAKGPSVLILKNTLK